MSVTAVVLTANDYSRRFDGIDEVLVHRSVFADAEQYQRSRFAAIARVRTSHFFFLDDDDALPLNVAEILSECTAHGAALAYTDEWVDNGEVTALVSSGPYERAKHLLRPTLVHHLALCDTANAKAALPMLPRGHYAPEMLLYWRLAGLADGPAYVPQPGYIWHRRPEGMHTWPATTLSHMRAALWCAANP